MKTHFYISILIRVKRIENTLSMLRVVRRDLSRE